MFSKVFSEAKNMQRSASFTDASSPALGYQSSTPVLGSSSYMMANGQVPNGRIDISSPLPEFNIPNYQQTSVSNAGFNKEAVSGLRTNAVSELFFSETNIDALQQGIRYRVYVETNGKFVIGRQSDQELKIVMRSIYLQHVKNSSEDCVEQVRKLNVKVLEWAVPEVLSNVKQFDVYRTDASTMPMPIDHAPLMTTKGSKVLEIKKWM